MVSLLYFRHAYNLSDEALVEHWSEILLWQYFSGREYYEHRQRFDPTQIGRLRNAIGKPGVEEMLKAAIETALAIKAGKRSLFERVIVDSRVQPKVIAYSVDSRLLEVICCQLVRGGRAVGIQLK